MDRYEEGFIDGKEAMRKEIERLREALEFYADENEWYTREGGSWKLCFNSGTVDGDGYFVAQQALKEGMNG